MKDFGLTDGSYIGVDISTNLQYVNKKHVALLDFSIAQKLLESNHPEIIKDKHGDNFSILGNIDARACS